jgi:broad specificity phosphatase PhoE
MTIVVIRHAERERREVESDDEFCEKNLQLSKSGVQQAKELGRRLATLGCNPAVYYTSCFAHARQTAAIVREVLENVSSDIVELCTLTPHYQGPREWRAGRADLDRS